MTDPETGISDNFWEGVYNRNPALFCLFNPSLPAELRIVNIHPPARRETPCTTQDILNWIEEISVNSSLLRELLAIGCVRRLPGDGKLETGEKQHVLVPVIADDALMNKLSVATKRIPTPDRLAH